MNQQYNGQLQNVLQTLNLTIVSDDECERNIKNFDVYHLCAFGENGGTCRVSIFIASKERK